MGAVIAVLVAAILGASEAIGQTAAAGPLDTATRLVTALERTDINLLLETFDDQATVFMPLADAPARLSGKEQIRNAFEALFKNSPAGGVPRTITPREVSTQLFGDTAIVTFHLGELPRQPAQGPFALGRRTLVLRRIGNRWLIVHLHASNVRKEQT